MLAMKREKKALKLNDHYSITYEMDLLDWGKHEIAIDIFVRDNGREPATNEELTDYMENIFYSLM